jgi:hypothetical protein
MFPLTMALSSVFKARQWLMLSNLFRVLMWALEMLSLCGVGFWISPVGLFQPDDLTVALFLQHLIDKFFFPDNYKRFGFYRFLHEINIFKNQPINAPELYVVRTADTRKFGLAAISAKEPFSWPQLDNSAHLYGVHNKGYCHLVTAIPCSISRPCAVIVTSNAFDCAIFVLSRILAPLK